MKWQLFFTIIAAGLLWVCVNGCGGQGPAPGLKPTVALTTSWNNVQNPSYIVSGGTLAISGSITEGTINNSAETQQVTSTSWSQSPAFPAGAFEFAGQNNVSASSLTNGWTAPVVSNVTQFTLSLQMETSLGAKSTTTIVINVSPYLPSFSFSGMP